MIVADHFNHRIQMCDAQGTCTAFGNRGSDPGQFSSPSGVAVDSQDRIIVADTRNDRIQILIVLESVLGSPSYCTVNGPCGAGEGDCDGGHECQAGLVCQHDVGAQYGFAGNIDVCLAVSGGGTVGSNVYCAVSGPCGAGEGDCDGNHECQTGLICMNDVGAKYGCRL